MTKGEIQLVNEIRCLYFDDEEDQRARFSAAIKYGWEALKNNIPIIVTTASEIDEAVDKLKNARDKYHVFVVDILGKKAAKDGYQAIKHARHDSEDLAIIALTMGSDIFLDKLKTMGADGLMRKAEVIEGSRDFVGKKILEVLGKRNIEILHSQAKLKIEDEKDFRLLAVVESIGRGNVINLTEDFLPHHAIKITPSYLTAGLSGASVLKISYEQKKNEKQPINGPARKLLLKISNDKETLQKELDQKTSMFPDDLFIPFIERNSKKNEPTTSGKWHAIGLRFKEDANTLLDWLVLENRKEARIDDVMTNLFLEPDHGLFGVYRHLEPYEEYPNIVLHGILESYPYRMATIQHATDIFEPLIRDIKAIYDLSIFDKTLINNYLTSNRIGQLDKERFKHKETSLCWSHGDLHGRNILVSASDKVNLIDPANISPMHWASDIARLSVDLMVSGLDHGAESYQWRKMKDWCDFSSKFIEGEPLQLAPHNDSNPNLCVALNWIRNNLDKIYATDDHFVKPEWEFRLALAVEFLRSTYRIQDLPAPKRVLGLLAACQALAATETAYNEFQKKIGL